MHNNEIKLRVDNKKSRLKKGLDKGIIKLLYPIIFSLVLINSCTNPIGSSQNPIGFGTIYPSPYYWPVWSKDGKTIAFLHSPIASNNGGHITLDLDSAGIWFINEDGTNQRFVSRIWGEFDLSYDNKWIVFGANRLIFKAPVEEDYIDTTKIVQLTFEGNDFFPEWSPDGTEIIYDKSLADSVGLAGSWLMSANGINKRFVLNAGIPSWYPDSKSIVGIIGISSTSTETRFIKYSLVQSKIIDTLYINDNSNEYPHYSPDGSKIIFQSQQNGGIPQICVIN